MKCEHGWFEVKESFVIFFRKFAHTLMYFEVILMPPEPPEPEPDAGFDVGLEPLPEPGLEPGADLIVTVPDPVMVLK